MAADLRVRRYHTQSEAEEVPRVPRTKEESAARATPRSHRLMDRNKLLTQLEVLEQDPMAWDYDREHGCYSKSVGDYRLLIQKVADMGMDTERSDALAHNSMNVMWSVTHEAFAVLVEQTPAATAVRGKLHAIAFTRAHILGKLEPQHAD